MIDIEQRQHNLIDIKDMSFKYNSWAKVNVLKNISLEIKQKEILFILGSNGSGKTTLL